MNDPNPQHDTLLDEVQGLLNDRNSLLKFAFADRPNYKDAVSARTMRNSDERTVPSQHALAWILSRLGHISVNPSKAENTFFLQRAYVYASGGETNTDENKFVVNYSEQHEHELLAELVKAARIERERSLNTIASSGGLQYSQMRKWFALTGERGIGKTFFLNHLFSKASEFLDSKETVWVRINLVLNHGYDNDLPAWIYAQAAKILLRYYDQDSTYRTKNSIAYPFHADLIEWVNAQGLEPDYKNHLMGRLIRMRQAFIEKSSDEDIAPELCDTVICKQLYRVARELGLAFIIVFDGFDRLDNDALSRARFRELASRLEKLCINSPAFGAAFLVVSRSPPFRTNASLNPYRLHFRDNEFKVEHAKFENIFLRRVETIIEWLDKNTPPGVRSEDIPDAIATLLDFKSYFILDSNVSVDYREAQHLDELLRSNNRAKSQILTLQFQDYCQRKSRAGYRLLELMVKAGFSYPPIPYKYVASNDGLTPMHVESFLYDSRFLPNVFRPPVPQLNFEKLDIGKYYDSKSLLHGVRLLQCVALFQELSTKGGGGEALVVNEIIDFLNVCFDYEQAVSVCLIYEYESFELLRILRDDATVDRHAFDHVRILPKGRYIIEKCIPEIAYLNLCAMRILVNGHAIDAGFIEATKLVTVADGGAAALDEWISTKIRNSVLLAALISEVNLVQSQAMRKLLPGAVRQLGRLGVVVVGGNVNRFFDPLARIEDQVRKEIESVVRDVYPNTIVSALRKIRRARSLVSAPAREV